MYPCLSSPKECVAKNPEADKPDNYSEIRTNVKVGEAFKNSYKVQEDDLKVPEETIQVVAVVDIKIPEKIMGAANARTFPVQSMPWQHKYKKLSKILKKT